MLAVWLSGFVLLFCCGAIEARAETAVCPLQRAKSHCDKAAKAELDAALFVDSNLKFDCCDFLPAIFDKTRKIEKTPQIVGVSRAKIAAPRFERVVAHDFVIAAAYRAPQLFQKKIFIKNQVFRI